MSVIDENPYIECENNVISSMSMVTNIGLWDNLLQVASLAYKVYIDSIISVCMSVLRLQ